MKMRMIGLAVSALILGGAVAFSSATLAQSDDQTPQSSDPMQIARGAKAWSEYCGRCHNVRDPGERSGRSWSVVSKHMRVRANIPGATAKDIEAFLKSSSND